MDPVSATVGAVSAKLLDVLLLHMPPASGDVATGGICGMSRIFQTQPPRSTKKICGTSLRADQQIDQSSTNLNSSAI